MEPKDQKSRIHWEEKIILVVVLFIIGSIGAATIRFAIDQIVAVAGPGSSTEAVALNVRVMLGGSWVFVAVLVWMLTRDLLRSRHRLMRDRATLQAFLEGAGDGIFAINRDFIITLWNSEAEAITGHSALDAIGKPLRDVMIFFRARDRAEDMVFIEEAMLYGERRSMSEPMYVSRKNGKEVPVGDSAAPLMDTAGNVIGCIVVFRDATLERKQSALRSEFSYASHQLKTPVTKALWALEAAIGKPVPERKDLEIAIGALQSIRKLSKEIVEVAEIDQGIVGSKPSKVRLKEIIAQAVQELESCRQEHGATLDYGSIGDEIAVQGDPKLVRRVLTEVMCNAFMYSKPGETVTVTAQEEPGKVTIEVHDIGLGIPDKEQALMFTKFFRGSNLDTTTMPGAGLGLYIAKRYVELLRGHIWFKSIEGSGSSFYLSLRPADNAGEDPEKVAEKP